MYDSRAPVGIDLLTLSDCFISNNNTASLQWHYCPPLPVSGSSLLPCVSVSSCVLMFEKRRFIAFQHLTRTLIHDNCIYITFVCSHFIIFVQSGQVIEKSRLSTLLTVTMAASQLGNEPELKLCYKPNSLPTMLHCHSTKKMSGCRDEEQTCWTAVVKRIKIKD